MYERKKEEEEEVVKTCLKIDFTVKKNFSKKKMNKNFPRGIIKKTGGKKVIDF